MAIVLSGIVGAPPVGPVMSNNPSFNNSQMAQAQQVQQQAQGVQPPPQSPQNQGIPVFEVPWHKATPGLKNIK